MSRLFNLKVYGTRRASPPLTVAQIVAVPKPARVVAQSFWAHSAAKVSFVCDLYRRILSVATKQAFLSRKSPQSAARPVALCQPQSVRFAVAVSSCAHHQWAGWNATKTRSRRCPTWRRSPTSRCRRCWRCLQFLLTLPTTPVWPVTRTRLRRCQICRASRIWRGSFSFVHFPRASHHHFSLFVSNNQLTALPVLPRSAKLRK